MSERSRTPAVRRRDVLHVLSMTAIPAALLTTVSAAKARPKEAPAESRRRYQETDHVKTFYRVNRYLG
jgi:hypothetical protein